MTRYSFSQLDQWVTKTEQRINAVTRDAAQTVVNTMQTPKAKEGRLPVDTGTLRRSLRSRLNGGAAAVGPDSFVLVAGSMKGGDVGTFTYGVDYAKFVNDGARGRPGDHFREYAADQWPQIIAESIRKAKAAVR